MTRSYLSCLGPLLEYPGASSRVHLRKHGLGRVTAGGELTGETGELLVRATKIRSGGLWIAGETRRRDTFVEKRRRRGQP